MGLAFQGQSNQYGPVGNSIRPGARLAREKEKSRTRTTDTGLRDLELIVFTRRPRDCASESVPFHCHGFPFRPDDRVGRSGGSLFALDGSQTEGTALVVHVLTIYTRFDCLVDINQPR